MAKLAELPESLDPALAEALRGAGIESLYSPPGGRLRDRARART